MEKFETKDGKVILYLDDQELFTLDFALQTARQCYQLSLESEENQTLPEVSFDQVSRLMDLHHGL